MEACCHCFQRGNTQFVKGSETFLMMLRLHRLSEMIFLSIKALVSRDVSR